MKKIERRQQLGGRILRGAAALFGTIALMLGLHISIGEISSGDLKLWPLEAFAQSEVAFSAPEVYKMASKDIFYLRVYQKDGTVKTVGTGFVLNDTTALTAAHVVLDGYKYEAVFENSPKTYFANLKKIDTAQDIAILEIQGLKDFWTISEPSPKGSNGLSLATGSLEHGDRVFAIGYPLKETKVITEGIVNAPSAQISGKTKTLSSTTVAPGMSGGPLLNERGEVVGLISGSTKTMNEMHLMVPLTTIKKIIGGQ